jgi:hypothetical protein
MRIRVPRRGRSRDDEAQASAAIQATSTATIQPTEVPADTIALVYELLDAHRDTAEMAEELCDDPTWAAHLDYLRALQRVGREMLARMPADEDRR